MSSSGLIYAVIVGAWAAYLVPMWLRRQDELNEARPTERFSTAIRLLSGRAGMERRYAKDLRARSTEEGSPAPIRTVSPTRWTSGPSPCPRPSRRQPAQQRPQAHAQARSRPQVRERVQGQPCGSAEGGFGVAGRGQTGRSARGTGARGAGTGAHGALGAGRPQTRTEAVGQAQVRAGAQVRGPADACGAARFLGGGRGARPALEGARAPHGVRR